MKIQFFSLALAALPVCWIANAADIAAESKRANDDAGVWKFPDGAEFYKMALRHTTTARRIVPHQTEGGHRGESVEKFRESSAGTAFYQQPAPDGLRPGMFYVNLRNMHDQAVYELEELAHHEGIPGYHMQIAIAQELTGIPKFRKLGALHRLHGRLGTV